MKMASITFFLLFSCLVTAQKAVVDFTHLKAIVQPYPNELEIKGSLDYTFILNQNSDSIFIDAQKMTISNLSLDGKAYPYSNSGQRIGFSAPNNLGEHKLFLTYIAKPDQALYFVGYDDDITGNEQIWTQGQGKYTSNWLPSFDDMTEKVEFDLSVVYDEKFTVVANGILRDAKITNGLKQWDFDMQKPMSSHLLAFAIGNYDKQQLISQSGIPIQNYYYPVDSLKVEPTYRYTKDIFDFLETEIGVPYPWQNYKQVPVHDFLYAGMENTGTTLFSDAYVIDSTAFVDKNYVNINAHELAHQWFGNLVTEKSGDHHWLQEGFATYYAYLAEKEIFGGDHFYWKLFESAKALKEVSDRGEGQSLLDPKASSLTFYEKGALALFILQEKVGARAFQNGIKNYLKKYQFKNVTVSDFLTEVQETSGINLEDFKKEWLNAKTLPFETIKNKLASKSESLKLFFKMEDISNQSNRSGLDFLSYFNKTTSVPFKRESIERYYLLFSNEDLKEIFDSRDILVRQMLAIKMDSIPINLKSHFEQLLEDRSFVTLETALLKLWFNFPEKRKEYLTHTNDIMGLPNRNIRLLWLTLALVTPDYNPSERPAYYEELLAYTGSTYNAEVRQIAFQYLTEIQALKGIGLAHLIKATNHHSWQFRNFARGLLDSLLEIEDQKNEIVNIAKQLNSSDLRYLKTKLQLP